MEPTRRWCFTLAFFSFFLLSHGESSNNFSANSLDSIIRDYAFRALIRHHTGLLYNVPLPLNLSGVEASVVRLRSRNFWRMGANFTAFRIPPRTLPLPYVRRLVIVYQDLGNWSSSYYDVPGYSLVAPVIGFLAYDASNITSNGSIELNLKVSGDPISISFPNVALPRGLNSTMKCVRFGSNRSVYFSEMKLPNVCSTTTTGHFAIVVPSEVPGSPLLPVKQREERKWRVWVIGCGGGVVGFVLVGLVGMGIFKLVKVKKMEKMESQANEGEALGNVWVGGSKMPSATMIRTQPVIENGSAP